MTTIINKLTIEGHKVFDTSYSNDIGNSFQLNDSFKVWLPNSEANYFSLVPSESSYIDDDGSTVIESVNWENEIQFQNENELIKYITKL